MQDCSNSSALAMELLQSCTKPSILGLPQCQWSNPEGYGANQPLPKHNKAGTVCIIPGMYCSVDPEQTSQNLCKALKPTFLTQEKPLQMYTRCYSVNSLWPSDVIWWYRFGLTLAQVLACCLMTPSHYLHQCWSLLSVFWLSLSSECPN